MTKIGGLIGAVLAIALVMFVGGQIDWITDQSDFVGKAVFAATGVIGYLVGSRIVRRVRARYAHTEGSATSRARRRRSDAFPLA